MAFLYFDIYHLPSEQLSYRKCRISQASLSWALSKKNSEYHQAVSNHYENKPIQIYRNISPPKTENFQIKILIFFIFLLKSIDCGYSLEPPRRGGSNEYPQYMLLSRNKKNNVYPCKPQFYNIKVGFKGVKVT